MCLMIDRTTAQIKVLRKPLASRLTANQLSPGEAEYIAANQAVLIEQAKEKKRLDYITQQYISGYIFTKLANDFNLNIYYLVS